MHAPTITNVSWTGSSHLTWKWKTSVNMSLVRATPLYIVPQNTPTPAKHIIVAIKVAYGIRVIQLWQALILTFNGYRQTVKIKKNNKYYNGKKYIKSFGLFVEEDHIPSLFAKKRKYWLEGVVRCQDK